MLKLKPILIAYWLAIVGLFFYSYTQVDLNLTLSQWSIWQVIQKSFQYIGWFQRPLSTVLYLVILLLLFACYLLLLWFVKKEKLLYKQFWQLVIPTSILLLFSYNAFSYDLFNYMFYGRIVTLHQENPYLHKALDYPTDPWTHFMRWTHNTYPYGPGWLILTIPLSFLGFQLFLPTLFLYKALMVGSFLGTTYFIGKILEKISPRNKLFGMAIFALNPLVVIESLVSAHNDIVMIFFSILAFYYLLNNKSIRAFLLLVLSIGIKFSTALLLPLLILIIVLQIQKKKIYWGEMFFAAVIIMGISIVLASNRTELQPWYLLWVLPFIPFLLNKRWIVIPIIILSFGLLLHYVPFLYTGNWEEPIPTIKFWITVFSILLGLVLGVFSRKKIAIMI